MSGPTISIRVTGLHDALNAIDPAILAKPARNLLTRSGIKVQGLAREKAPIDRGGLRDSIAYEVDAAYFPRSVKVGSNLVYARATELGRPPGKMPPPDALEAWARRKGLPPGSGFAIAIKIRNEGTEPRPFLLPAVHDAEPYIQKYVGTFGREIVAEAAARGGGG